MRETPWPWAHYENDVEREPDDTPGPAAGGDDDRETLLGLLAARGAQRIPHPGGDLLAHLRRTARRLESWGAPCELVTAGLCHAAYGTQSFPTALFALAERDLLRSRLGDAAEALVYAYCARDRTHNAAGCGEWRDRFSGEYWTPSEGMQRRLAELTVANEIDVVEHAQLSRAQLGGIAELVDGVTAKLSQAAWSCLSKAAGMREIAPRLTAPSGDVELAYRDLGTQGARVVLWHGGASPELTWSRQHALSAAFQLRIPWRRGYAPSAITGRQDWERDARDLLRVMPERAHVVAHSYGGIGALIAAATAPERFQTLTLIEAPLWSVAADDPSVRKLAELGRAFANGAAEARAAFLELAWLPEQHPQTLRTERIARNFRDPGEAAPSLDTLRLAGVPVAVVSGSHNRAIERVCDALGAALAASRFILPGAGHAVARVPEFNTRLRDFVTEHSTR